MADHGPVRIRQGKLDELLKVYKQTYQNILAEITTATAAGKFNLVQVMNRINRELESFGIDANKWVNDEMPQYYLDGLNQSMQDLKALGLDPGKAAAIVNRDTIAALVDDTALAFAEGIRTVSRDARGVLNDAKKQQINRIIADGKLTGDAARTIAGAVENSLRKDGLIALIDRGGRAWGFETYANMLVLTKASEARNQGMVNLMLSNGYDLVQVSNHNSKHKACHYWEGKVLSITGETPTGKRLPGGYTVKGTLAEAKDGGLFHPNCKHAINVLVPELARTTKAYDPEAGQYVTGA